MALTRISRRSLLRLGATGLALAAGRLAGLPPAWAGPGHAREHGHEPEAGPYAHSEPVTPHDHGGPPAPHGRPEPAAPHDHKESRHGVPSDGHPVARSGPAHGERPHGHASDAHGHEGHGHGKEAFERYGLVRAEPGYREYNVKLTRFRFEPSVFRVERGERVRFNLDSVDATHGFYVDGYGVKVVVPEKEQKTVELVADRPGAFRIRCAVTCGSFHPFMIGKLVVSPNRQFWAGAVAALALPAALLAFLARQEGNGS